MKPGDILKTLDQLGQDEFERFKWFLEYKGIAKSNLEHANRQQTVTVMVQNFRLSEALQVTNTLLKEISRNDLIKTRSSRPEGQ